jgi:hypothetical protein
MLHRLVDHCLAVFANPVSAFFIALHIDACGLPTLRTNQHHVRDMDLSFELDAARVDLPACLRLDLFLVFGTDIDSLYHHAILIWQDIDHFAAFSFILEASTDHFDSVAFANLDSHTSRSQLA